MKNKVWNIIEKLLDNFLFQIVISCVVGGTIFALTPKEATLLVKFGTYWYIVFISLIAFLIIAFVVWLYNVIKKKKYQKTLNKIDIENKRKQLYEITDKWHEEDVKILRQLVESNNKEIVRRGFDVGSNSLFTSNMLESKPGDMVDLETSGGKAKIRTTIYWLKEDAYNTCKLILEQYGKLSKFDKGEKYNGKTKDAK